MVRRCSAMFVLACFAHGCSCSDESSEPMGANAGRSGMPNANVGAAGPWGLQSGGAPQASSIAPIATGNASGALSVAGAALTGSGAAGAPQGPGAAGANTISPNNGGGGSINIGTSGAAYSAGGPSGIGAQSSLGGSGGIYGNGQSGDKGVAAAGAQSLPSPSCSAYGQGCTRATDCCSGLCDLVLGACVSSLNVCSPAGAACVTSTECCNLSCGSGRCSSKRCTADNETCQSDAECCGQSCIGGRCAALNLSCKTSGNPCTQNGECCGGLCNGGYCAIGASFCVQTDDICARDTDCCTGGCTIAAGAKLGICAPPTSSAANCGGVEGTLCQDCGTCCSRLCAPYGPTGASICQPASGCHVVGELCTRNEDCCGGDPTSNLPGAGNVTCDLPAGALVGRCRNATGCAPQGAICHYKNYTLCSISSARNACCSGVGNSGECQLDTLGVPRCNGLGTDCRAAGQECASADDCCNDVPCTPGLDGKLRCYTPPTGGNPACVPSGGTCTIAGDCCPGTTCIRPTGASSGVCGVQTPPPSAGGASGAGGTTGAGGTSAETAGASHSPGDAGASGVAEGGSPNGGATGTVAAGGSPNTTTAPGTCSLYGQICTTAADCCNSVPCTKGVCAFPIN